MVQALLLAALQLAPWIIACAASPAPAVCESCEFARGFAGGLGLKDVSQCYKDGNASTSELWKAFADYRKGDWMDKCKALVAFGKGTEELMKALKPCSQGMADYSDYVKLWKYLQDPRYYSVHNGLTLLLNTAEDHHMFGEFEHLWSEGKYDDAGAEIAKILLSVLDNPGIPGDNGTEALQIARGFTEGFSGAVDTDCFKDARVTLPALIGGVMDLLSVVGVPEGLAKVFQGLEGLVPLYKDCMADKKEIMDLLKAAGDFKNPQELAERIAKDVEKSGIDLTLEATAAVLDYKGHEWTRFGQDLGQILAKIFIAPSAAVTAVVV